MLQVENLRVGRKNDEIKQKMNEIEILEHNYIENKQLLKVT